MTSLYRWLIAVLMVVATSSCAGRNRASNCDSYAPQAMRGGNTYSGPILERPDRPGHVIGNGLRQVFAHP